MPSQGATTALLKKWTPFRIPRIGEGEWHDFGEAASSVIPGGSVSTVIGKVRGVNAVAGTAGVADTMNGRPCVLITAGSSQYYTADALSSLVTGDDTPFTVFGVIQLASTGATQYFLSAGSSAANTRFHRLGAGAAGSTSIERRGDGDGATTSLTGSSIVGTTGYAFVHVFLGTTVETYKDTTVTSVGTGALNAGSITINRFTYGCMRGTTNTSFTTARLCEFVVVPGAVTGSSILHNWFRYAHRKWQTP